MGLSNSKAILYEAQNKAWAEERTRRRKEKQHHDHVKIINDQILSEIQVTITLQFQLSIVM